MPLGKGLPDWGGERGANASLTGKPGVSVMVQRLQGGATQVTHYAINMQILVFVY